MNKRIRKELTKLYNQQNKKPLLDNEFIISTDSTLELIKVLVKLPLDSVYKYKFLRLNFEIPEDYPYSPPKVTFINHDSVRIHPNMYEDGKCCATILNTWGNDKYEKWTSSMTIETVIISFMSFFDNDPYAHEPGDRGDDSYTIYVLYQSWSSCLIKYLEREEDELFQEYLQQYMVSNYNDIIYYLGVLESFYLVQFYYTKCFEIGWYEINYPKIIKKINRLYNRYIQYSDDEEEENIVVGSSSNTQTESEEKIIKCCICMDTHRLYDPIFFVKFACNHEFHRVCMRTHEGMCPVCRSELTNSDLGLLNFKWKRKSSSSTPTTNQRKRVRLE